MAHVEYVLDEKNPFACNHNKSCSETFVKHMHTACFSPSVRASSLVLLTISLAAFSVIEADGTGDEPKENSKPVNETAPPPLGQTKGWRLQFSGEYTHLDGKYDFDSDFLPYKVKGDRNGEIYGGTLSLGLPKWKETSWMTLSYRQGEIDGHNDYEGIPTRRTAFEADLTEFEIGYRSALKNFVGGVSFVYQNWENRESIPFFGRSEYDDNFYLFNFDFGPGWLWTFKSGLGLGLKASMGGGIGYADIGRQDAEGNGVLFDGFGAGSGFLQYAIKGRGFRGKIFVEGGYKGLLYYGLNSSEDENDETHFWRYYGPFAKVGMMFQF